MRDIVGFALVNAAMVGVGLAVLRATGLLARGADRRAVLLVLGPGFVAGLGVLGPALCVLLVIGIPLTLPVTVLLGAVVAGIAERIARQRPAGSPVAASPLPGAVRWGRRAVFTLVGLFAVYVAYAYARAPTRGDDARIWSIRGLTLAYYHRLQPEIFLNPLQSGAHPAYPLFQPVVEALLSEAMGGPRLRMYHTELWLIVAAAVWSAGFLIARRAGDRGRRTPVWLGALALFVLTPISLNNVYIGDADITGSVLLALGGLAVALWLEREDRGALAFGAIMLAAAGSTKDEDFLAGALVLVVAGVWFLVRHRDALRRSMPQLRPAWPWLGAVAWFAVFIGPWRLWLSAHHLSDSVQPPLPKALSPVYVVDHHHLRRVLAWLLQQVSVQWGLLAAIFLVTCGVCLLTGTARRITAFYLAAVAVIAVMITWLYATTPLSLDFLLPTSMDRTVGLFMVPSAFATAHLLALLITSDR